MDLLTYFKSELQKILDSKKLNLLVQGPTEDRALHDQIYEVRRRENGSFYSRVKLTREFVEDNDKSHVDLLMGLDDFGWVFEDNLKNDEIIIITTALTFDTQEFK